uniref:F-box domain-containing protein n=1 Tax=Meloidogyne enterolobii TaxID=390850 RepID=A0A6V7UCT1_MELEN|nr:unnamed protein product [Meloidogyne enterolobii]
MKFLPSEVQLDIFKYLNFHQLLIIQQTNFYFKNLINEYEGELARMKLNKLVILFIHQENSDRFKSFNPNPKIYDFQLSEGIEKKWKCGIKEHIPMLLSINNSYSDCFFVLGQGSYYLQFPNLPKTIKQMKIARYLFQQLFKYFFEYVQFDQFVFNPQMINLLFDENKTKIPLQIHSRKANIIIYYNYDNYLLNFALNHLISDKFTVCFQKIVNIEHYTSVLFEILANCGNKFSEVIYDRAELKLFYLIKQHIETSKNISEMVKEIKFYGIKVRDNNLESTNYQLSNIYNPEIKFSVKIEVKRSGKYINVEIMRIN